MSIHCSGVILAGGQNKRFGGQNKAFIRIGQLRIIDRLAKVCARLFDQVVLVTNDPAIYMDVDALIVTDHYPVRSSLTGLHAGLFAAAHEYAFFTACDTPFVQEALVRMLIDAIERKTDIVVPCTSVGYEPMFAVYRKTCLPVMTWHLENNLFKISQVFRKMRVKKIEEAQLRKADPELVSFFNVNTPEDLTTAQDIYEKIKTR